MTDENDKERMRLAEIRAATAVLQVPNRVRDIAGDNRSVFGAILRGELPATILYEDDDVLCFRDIRPVCDHHSLVIPKTRQIHDIGHCKPEDCVLLEHMVAVAEAVIRAEFPVLDVEAAKSENLLSLGFHRWPMLSVPHLHLHCIYPLPCKRFWHRWLFPRNYGPFYVPASDEIERLGTLQERKREVIAAPPGQL